MTTYDQLLHCFALRAICFMEEEHVPATQTFDGNDYQATHFIVYADQEPIGSVRVRWFHDFAKFERTCFRTAYRNIRVIRESANFVFEHVARKGFDRVVTHAKPKYALLWRRALGFRLVEEKTPLCFAGQSADEPYLELVKDLRLPSNAISSITDMGTLFRTEGHWDVPSPFESVDA